MYSYGSQPSFTNNPFVEDPSSAHARFPDLTASHPQQYPPQYSPVPYQQPIHAQNQYSYAPTQLHPQPTGYAPQYPAQMQSGYPMTYASNAGYPQTMQMQSTTATPSYLSEFDPMSQQQNQTQIGHAHAPAPAHAAAAAAPQGVGHPRDVIRAHKSGLEAWDTYSWKQLFGACDALKEAWSARKQQAESIVRQYAGPDPTFGYNSQVEGWKQVLKDANDHFDTIVASTFQLHEVFNSYRQSGDPASKRRVRESCNAAVKGLPDWPSN